MSPYERAIDYYRSQPHGSTLEADLWHHLKFGWVLSTPRIFVLARSVRSTRTAAELNDLTLNDPDGDAWFIWFATGDISDLLTFEPRKKLIAFARRGVLRWRTYDGIRRLLQSRAPREA